MTEAQLKKGPTGRYGVIQAGYWIDYLVISNFAAVFLSGRGFATRQIGTITALGSLLSCILQQVTGTIADKSTKPLKWKLAGFVALCMLCFISMKILPDNFISTFVFYLTAITLQIAMQPLLSSLCLQFSNNGYRINFGFSRACGSLGYAVSALFMSSLTDRFGAEVIIPVYLSIYAVVLVILIFFPVPQKDADARIVAGKAVIRNEQPSTMKEFLHKYHRFMLLMIGFVLLWFMNNLLSTYMIYVIRYFHASEALMSVPFAIAAFAEIPAVIFGSSIMRRLGAGNMLRISAIGGVIKGFLYLISPNVQFFIAANLTHFLHSGFYQVAAVYYCYMIVSEADIVKSQALLGIFAAGISVMLANYVGGLLVDSVSIPMIFAIGLAVNVISLLIIWYATDTRHFRNEPIRSIQ